MRKFLKIKIYWRHNKEIVGLACYEIEKREIARSNLKKI